MNSLRVRLVLALACLFVSYPTFAQIPVSFNLTAPRTNPKAGGDHIVLTAKAVDKAGKEFPFSGVLIWTSDAKKVLTFDKPDSADATPVGPGPANVTVTDLISNAVGHIKITVDDFAPPISFRVDSSTVSVATGQTLTPVISGNYGTNEKPVWKPVPNVKLIAIPGSSSDATTDGTIITAGKVTGPVEFVVSILNAPALPSQAVTITVTAPPAATSVKPGFFAAPLDQSSTLVVTGTASDSISVYMTPPSYTAVCSDPVKTVGTALMFGPASTPTAAVTLASAVAPATPPPTILNLIKPLTKGSKLCLFDATAKSGFNWTNDAPIIVGDAPQNPTIPVFADIPKAGSWTFKIKMNASDAISVASYPAGAKATCDPTPVSLEDKTLMTVTSIGTADASGVSLITLGQPLVEGATLCLAESASGFSPSYANQKVFDTDNTWRARIYFLVGIQASNQLSSSGSSTPTAGQYLEGGFGTQWLRAKDHLDWITTCKSGTDQIPPDSNPNHCTKGRKTPGISTNLDLRLSPIPVSASQTTSTSTTTTTTSGTAATSTVAPNVLSSQQSVRAVGSFYSPWKVVYGNNHTDFFTIAPLSRAGFGTLINASGNTSTTSSTSSTSATITTATSYSSAYYFWSLGTRLAWDRYSGSDKAPQTVAQFLATFGEYSNLPSYVCLPTTIDPVITPGTSSPTPAVTTTTACNQGQYKPVITSTPTGTPSAPTITTTTTHAYAYNRTVRPRIDIEALFHLPNYPFVLGVDANLQQYAVFGRNNLDYLNKPGNDIRIFVGFTINLSSFVSKLGSPTL